MKREICILSWVERKLESVWGKWVPPCSKHLWKRLPLSPPHYSAISALGSQVLSESNCFSLFSILWIEHSTSSALSLHTFRKSSGGQSLNVSVVSADSAGPVTSGGTAGYNTWHHVM